MLLVVLTMMMIGLPQPVHAATRSVRDPVHDAPAAFDLTRATFTNSKKQIRIRVDLRRASNGVLLMVDFNQSFMGRQKFSIDTIRNLDGTIQKNLYVGLDGRPQHVIRCPGLTAKWQMRLNRVVLEVPQFCLGEGGRGDQRFWITTGTFHDLHDRLGRTRVPYK